MQRNHHIEVTKFVDYPTLETLGLAEPLTQLLQKIGFKGFVSKWEPTQRFNLEFLSTPENNEGEDRGIEVYFSDKPYILTMQQVKTIFGWRYVNAMNFHHTNDYNEDSFWHAITHLRKTPSDKLLLAPPPLFVMCTNDCL